MMKEIKRPGWNGKRSAKKVGEATISYPLAKKAGYHIVQTRNEKNAATEGRFKSIVTSP